MRVQQVIEIKVHTLSPYVRLKQVLNRDHVGSVVEWLERRAYDQHGLGSKSTPAILLCPWERHFTPFSLLGGLCKQF